MIRVSRFKRGVGGCPYVRYRVGGRVVDESTKTRDEVAAERLRTKRQIEINARIQPVKYADVGDLIDRYRAALPPGTSDSGTVPQWVTSVTSSSSW